MADENNANGKNGKVGLVDIVKEDIQSIKTEIPVKDRDGWEKYLAEKSAEAIKLTAEIEAAEREIDAIVYKLFDLTPDEIKLLENSLEGQC